ncbi:MAG: UTP--glucose-1-phosphate uridylyltransferase GalU [Thermoplasmatota archaeon]
MKAVIPAAGLGTRFLPATKSQPKEMLPVVDKPAIQYVVEEAVASGIDDILIVTGRGKRAIEDHFDRSLELEQHLRENNKGPLLSALDRINELSERGHIHYIRQREHRGLGDAVMCARKHVGSEPFAVLLGDDIIVSPVPCTRQLLEVHAAEGCSVVALERVPVERLSSYGVVQTGWVRGALHEILGLVEKPGRSEAPSDLAIMGRYVLTPAIFDCLERTAPGRAGEVQLTDALHLLLERERVLGVEFEGRRYDIGDKLDWLRATLELALEREEFGADLRALMATLLARQEEACGAGAGAGGGVKAGPAREPAKRAGGGGER